MSTVFITGASGFIGRQLAVSLANAGNVVHVLLRPSHNTDFLQHPNIRFFEGDLLDKTSISDAMAGCSQVYHLAGLSKMWMQDKSAYYQVNVTGTENVLSVAAALPAGKVIVISTAGVLPPSEKNHLTNENTPRRPALYTEYEKTKNDAEQLAFAYQRKGLPVVVMNPTRVFGPGPVDDSNSATMMVRDYILGKWKIIPGNGKGTMNYVYIDDAVTGMITAMEVAQPGSQYIIGGENADYDQFFALIKELSGIDHSLYHIPYTIVRGVAWWEDTKTKWFKIKPLITSEWIKKLPYDWSKDVSKASQELNYHPRSLKQGLRQTIEWLHQTHQI
jgi:nucleoside-diphosphate-sugar epimerase